jgi:hypothetical protein
MVTFIGPYVVICFTDFLCESKFVMQSFEFAGYPKGVIDDVYFKTFLKNVKGPFGLVYRHMNKLNPNFIHIDIKEDP